MIVALISDTHDNAPLVARAVEFLREAQPDLVLHLGDITTPQTVRMFRGLPVRFVSGNNDDAARLAPALAECSFPKLAEWWSEELEGVRVGATHGHLRGRLRQLRDACDIVLHGHTHRRRVEREEGALMVNPGALHRAERRTMALLRLPEKEVAWYEVRDGRVAPLERQH